jgi:hypothetical protein
MAVSQFKVYDWGDPEAPKLDGTSGSMVRLLDAVLITGYGSKTPAGWLQPIPTYSSSIAVMACYQQPSGSGCTLLINDTPPTGSTTGSGVPPGSQVGGTMDAWATGWEFLLGFTSSVSPSGSGQVGSGSGQFPLPLQTGLTGIYSTSGSVGWLKSESIGSLIQRPWRIYVDAYTLYFFVGHGAYGERPYSLYAFGDFYSLKQTPDNYKCMIIGRLTNNTSTAPSVETTDYISTAGSNIAPFYIQRNVSGRSASTIAVKVGDAGKCALSNGSANYTPITGLYRSTATGDNSGAISPLWVAETTYLRGRFRGLYHITTYHPLIQDGQIISGSNHYNGKIFQAIKGSASNGVWAIEISNTVETND